MEFSEFLPWLRDMGSAGAVMVVVWFFLKHVRERDSEINAVLRELTSVLRDTLEELRKR